MRMRLVVSALVLAVVGALAWGAMRMVRAASVTTATEVPTTHIKKGSVTIFVAARGELQGGNSEMLTAPMVYWAQGQLGRRLAREWNDGASEAHTAYPDRFVVCATLPMQDPKAAATELTRAVQQLGFKGALVNGHTQGRYYDDRAYDELWDRLQALDVPLYLHPIDFPSVPVSFEGHAELNGATWGWGVETATHALRLLFGGVFDRFPRLKVILGHMGEGLPFQRWRFDSRFAAYPHGLTLQRAPSEYIGRNIVITTSGVCSPAALAGAIAEMGAEAVMFSVDYPYESTAVAADFIEAAPLDERTRALVCHGNAERLLKLDLA